jgi:hypothetical protein
MLAKYTLDHNFSFYIMAFIAFLYRFITFFKRNLLWILMVRIQYTPSSFVRSVKIKSTGFLNFILTGSIQILSFNSAGLKTIGGLHFVFCIVLYAFALNLQRNLQNIYATTVQWPKQMLLCCLCSAVNWNTCAV